MNKKYLTKEDLVKDIIKAQTDMPKGLVFAGITDTNQVLFDLKIDVKKAKVIELNEYISKANYIDRYYQSLSYLVEK